MVKKRHFEIINLMINSKNEITIKDIADLYNMTERSIRYDINELNIFFKEKNRRDIIEINNNKLKNLIPNGSPYSSSFINPKEQNIDIEVIKGKDVDIDIIYGFNYYRGILKENNELFEKIGEQKYIFKKIGTYTIDFK